jgi:hypothetical protein
VHEIVNVGFVRVGEHACGCGCLYGERGGVRAYVGKASQLEIRINKASASRTLFLHPTSTCQALVDAP